MRILLDSPEGLGLRFQYLNIPLSDAEQAAFYERFGTQLEDLLLEGFDDIDRKLYRIEFLHDCSKPLLSLQVNLELREVYTHTDIGYFRFLADITNDRELPSPKLIIGCQSWPPKKRRHIPAYSGMTYFVFSDVPFEQLYGASQTFNSVGEKQLRLVADLWKNIPFAKLGDIDNLNFNIYTTASLFDKIKTVTIIANDYVIAQASAEDLVALPRDKIEDEYGTQLFWPTDLYESEEKFPSLMVLLKDVTPTAYFHFYPYESEPFAFWSLNFSRYTPRKTD